MNENQVSSSTCSLANRNPKTYLDPRPRNPQTFQDPDFLKIFEKIFELLSINLPNLSNQENFSEFQKTALKTLKDSRSRTKKIGEKLRFIQSLLDFDESVYICALIILDRILKSRVKIGFKSTIRRLAFVSLFISFKMFSGGDKVNVEDFSKICSIPKEAFEENEIIVCCEILDWKLNVEADYYQRYRDRAMKYC